MSTDTTNPEEIARTEYTYDGCLVNELDRIDLSHLEFDDNDDWLYMPPRCSTESTIQDLYTWLKTEPELGNKKCIDTRTFTRPKKRTSRMSFESIFENLPRCVTNIWKPQNLDDTHTENMGKFSSTSIENKESVPLMLKPSVKATVNVLSNENLSKSGQESMEVFLNMSQSKGIDSFINLGEPEFNDPLMSMSQPSILYTSIIGSVNESTFTEDNVTLVTRKDTNGQQVTHRHSNVQEKSNPNDPDATFVMQSDNNLISPNETYRVNTLNDTFCKDSAPLDIGLNETYDAAASDQASALPSNLYKKNTDGATMSSIFTTEPNTDGNFAQLQNQASNSIDPLNVTYLSTAKSAGSQDTMVSVKSDAYKNTVHANKMKLDVTCNAPSDETAVLFEAQDGEDVLDVSFTMPICGQSTPIHSNALNPTSKLAVKHSEQQRPSLYSTLKAPTSLRKELLAEIRRSDERRLDVTYNHVIGDQRGSRDTKEDAHVAHNENAKIAASVFPLENRYHTYRKSTLTTTAIAKNQCRERDTTIAVPQRDLTADRKFYTFTKKSNNNPVEKNNGGVENIVENNTEVARLNMDSTFCKPLPKALPKRNARMFSKLPQFLQKSNPNLVSSSLRSTVSLSGSTSLFNAGYIKGSQPNIMQNVEKSSLASSKLHPFGKLKSGSEQRLVEVNVKNSEFSAKVVTGSTESIESTQSAHSAPDLDDRLSTCSDSSHNSCNKGTMNIEQLHQLVRMQEESLKQDSAPKPHKRVLENTWVETKINLPSPILKNGIEHGEIDTHSLLSANVNIKCSSPLLSPTGSSHVLNNDGNSESNTGKVKDEVAVAGKTQGPNQVVPKIENKTRLRQPTNWGTGSKPSAVISGIPRPASRIPALRFVRPNNAKANQADLRKGYT
ncbi:uncharacterized protein LOC116842829 isoform X2 [Odontomachus brunneus]|uniref:uncharacterized protein LOC116842829 isoform X2 n=1 Tax=Odontomachus brunneus TaxID=486640 RepID=UPI0013F1E0D8|nr:uncharacterized protein LOC116842829 isoform X2 [Odontomachus brunneus]